MNSPDCAVSSIYESDEYVQLLLRTVREHDAEKLALLQRIDEGLRPAQEEARRLQSEVLKRDERIAQLRAELSEGRLMLQEERERATRLLHENTVLHARADDERQRAAVATAAAFIQRGTGKESKELKELKEVKDSSMSLRHAARAAGGPPDFITTAAAAAHTNIPSTSANIPSTSASASIPDNNMIGVTRASALLAALESEAQMLREQLDAQRVAYEHERARRLHEERERERHCAATAQRQDLSLSSLHRLHQSCLADLVRTRHESRAALRDSERRCAELRAALESAQRALTTERQRHCADVRAAAGTAKGQEDAVLRRLRAEVAERALLGERQRRALAAERDACAADARRARAELQRQRRRQRREEERRRLEAEGVKSEVDLMRQALRAMEKKVYYSQGRCLSE